MYLTCESRLNCSLLQIACDPEETGLTAFPTGWSVLVLIYLIASLRTNAVFVALFTFLESASPSLALPRCPPSRPFAVGTAWLTWSPRFMHLVTFWLLVAICTYCPPFHSRPGLPSVGSVAGPGRVG